MAAQAGGQVEALGPQQEMEIIVRAVCATKLPTLTFEDNKCAACGG